MFPGRVTTFSGPPTSGTFKEVGFFQTLKQRKFSPLELSADIMASIGWAALSDILLAVYPIFVFRKLRVSRKVKVAMLGLLGGGVL